MVIAWGYGMKSVVFAVFFSIGVAHAGEFGYTIYASNIAVDDTDGSTEGVSYLAPFNGFYADSLKRDLRYQVEVSMDTVNLEAGVNQVGQQVKYQGLGVSLQRRFRLSSNLKPWFGMGVDYVNVRYRERHTVDQGGFLADRYPDRDESGLNLVLNAATYWAFNHSWDYGLTAKFSPSVSSDSTFLSIGISAVYK